MSIPENTPQSKSPGYIQRSRQMEIVEGPFEEQEPLTGTYYTFVVQSWLDTKVARVVISSPAISRQSFSALLSEKPTGKGICREDYDKLSSVIEGIVLMSQLLQACAMVES